MRMTALDVQNHAFPRRFKGYDVDEVEHFRSALVEDWAALNAEADTLRKRVVELEARVEQLDTHEQALRNALVTAQGMSDDLRRTAEHEAQMRVGQAELKAEKILAAAHRQASRLAQEIRELRSLRSRMTGSVRATIETHLALLEGFSQDPEEEFDTATQARLESLASSDAPAAFEAPEPETPTTGVHEPVRAADAPSPPEEKRQLDALVIPTGEFPAPRPAASSAPDPPAPGWTTLPDQG